MSYGGSCTLSKQDAYRICFYFKVIHESYDGFWILGRHCSVEHSSVIVNKIGATVSKKVVISGERRIAESQRRQSNAVVSFDDSMMTDSSR